MDSGSIAEVRIGLANIGGTAMRATATEQALVGASSMAEIEAAGTQAADGLEPIADEDADVEFRKHLVSVLTKRAIATAAGISFLVSDTATLLERGGPSDPPLSSRLPKNPYTSTSGISTSRRERQAQGSRCVGRHYRSGRLDGSDRLVACAEIGPGIRLTLIRPQSHRSFRLRGNGQRWVDAQVRGDRRTIHDVHPRISEDAVVSINHSNIGVGPDHTPSNEVGRERRVDVFENTRTGNTADLVRDTTDHVLGNRHVRRSR